MPPSLPRSAGAHGLFDSSFNANEVLTNFRYALPFGLDFDEDSGLYEYSRHLRRREKNVVAESIDRALDVIRANAQITRST